MRMKQPCVRQRYGELYEEAIPPDQEVPEANVWDVLPLHVSQFLNRSVSVTEPILMISFSAGVVRAIAPWFPTIKLLLFKQNFRDFQLNFLVRIIRQGKRKPLNALRRSPKDFNHAAKRFAFGCKLSG